MNEINAQIDEWIECTNRWMNEINAQIDEWMNEINALIVNEINAQMDI